ncbi:MJ0042 family finger-like domain protein [Collimonas arenae]|uniref:MJ0042-type zinc finger domain-containing protein n=1 Tax=Collimonas arenae TaxID=279058 RepID=UPI0007782B0C|nr:MJ0042-type zinc finger domain-containing protein [Collimonas arenae]AMO98659.1 MJ0042 family finger-like domain protein [Collimonas arenae]
MALATQCPHCQTTFRVANDQLKLRGGLVRCGSCREVFNGIEHLVRPEVATPVSTPVAARVAAPEPAPAATQTASPAATEIAATTEQQTPPSSHPHQDEPAAAPEPERVLATDAAVVVATDHPLPTVAHSEAAAHSPAPAEKMSTSVSDRVEAAIDGLEEDLRIAEETSQSAPADVHHTPFGLVKPSAPAEHDEESGEAPQPNVWHRHIDVDPHVDDENDSDKQMARMTLMHVAGENDYTVDAEGKAAARDNAASSDDDELDRIIDELQRKPWRGEKNASMAQNTAEGSESNNRRKGRDRSAEPEQEISDEPDFVLSARRKQRIGGALRGIMWVSARCC